MAKQGMKRPERTHMQLHNQVDPVPELQGKAKHGKERANPIISGTEGASLKQNVQHAGSKAAHNNKSPQMAAQKTESEKDQPFSAAKSSLKM